MSNTPIFDQLLGEYDEKKQKQILDTMEKPFLSPVKPPLPKRTLAQLITPPEPDPEFARKIQEFVETAPMQILERTPVGSFIKSMDVVEDGRGGLALEAEVLTPTAYSEPDVSDEMVSYAQRDAAATNAMFNGMRPQMAWVDEMQSGEEDEIYIAPTEPITFDRVKTDFKTELATEGLRQRQLALYQHGVMEGRQKAAELYGDRFVPPMTGETTPSWIADEIRESNEALSDPEPVEDFKLVEVSTSENIHPEDLPEGGLPAYFKGMAERFRQNYPHVQNVAIHRKDELDGTITISVTGTSPEQTDESVNAASNHADSTSTVKPLWVTNEE
uniref:Tail assembly chaperone n=1 Tax=Streptomyces phage Scarif TaxID=3158858 RepID=A0AAU7GXD2_9CAUD